MWHKAIWKGHLMRLELTRVGLLVELANHNTTRGAFIISIVTSLLSRQRNDSFLKKIISSDEKCVFYEHLQHKRQWIDKNESLVPILKPKLHGRKVILFVCWGYECIIHFEFLNHNQTLNADFYSQQLQRVHKNLRKCRPLVSGRNVVLHNDNALPHSVRITLKKILALGWFYFRPPYSPDFVPSDFNLYPSRHLIQTPNQLNFTWRESTSYLINGYYLWLNPICIYVCVCIYMYVYIYICMCVCVCVCVCAFERVRVCVYIYIHIYTRKHRYIYMTTL